MRYGKIRLCKAESDARRQFLPSPWIGAVAVATAGNLGGAKEASAGRGHARRNACGGNGRCGFDAVDATSPLIKAGSSHGSVALRFTRNYSLEYLAINDRKQDDHLNKQPASFLRIYSKMKLVPCRNRGVSSLRRQTEKRAFEVFRLGYGQKDGVVSSL